VRIYNRYRLDTTNFLLKSQSEKNPIKRNCQFAVLVVGVYACELAPLAPVDGLPGGNDPTARLYLEPEGGHQLGHLRLVHPDPPL
jgi:hypothetical protein